MILESLAENPKTMKELRGSTRLDQSITDLIVQQFLIQNVVIIQHDNQLSLNSNINQEIKDLLYNKENIKIEIGEILDSSIHNKIDLDSQDSLKLKKVYMSEKEERIYKGLLYNLESFINSLTNTKGEISNKKIIFWGENTYENVVNYSLNA